MEISSQIDAHRNGFRSRVDLRFMAPVFAPLSTPPRPTDHMEILHMKRLCREATISLDDGFAACSVEYAAKTAAVDKVVD